MAVGKRNKSEELMNNCKSNNFCEGGITFGRVIPVSKWHVWCYEKWRFAPRLHQYPVDSDCIEQHYIHLSDDNSMTMAK